MIIKVVTKDMNKTYIKTICVFKSGIGILSLSERFTSVEILDAVRNRRSIRDFQKKKIPDELISELVDALIWAPSAGNLQARKFYFIKNNKVKKQLAAAALHQNFISDAPLVIVG